jgi:hypothetical protein
MHNKEEAMARRTGLGVLVAMAALAVAPPAFAAPASRPVRVGSPIVQHVQGGYCETLRRACLYRRELGEQGQGNCRRYQQECSGRGYGAPQYGGDPRGGGRCHYWRNRCANAYGWGSKGWHDCMRYGAPGC